MEVFSPPSDPLVQLLIPALTNHSAVGGTPVDSSNRERSVNLSIKHPIELDRVNQNNTGNGYKNKSSKANNCFFFEEIVNKY